MYDTRENFEGRLKVISRKNIAMTHGYKARVRGDGLIIMKPRRRRFEFPLRGLIMVLIGFFFFKAFILASIGPDIYGERIEILQNGTVFERGGAWVMQNDPISQAIVDYVGPVFR